MPGKDDVRNNIDEGWTLPEGAKGEKGADKFIYTDEDGKRIQSETSGLADLATKDLYVDAEASLENGYNAFSGIAQRENLIVDNNVMVLGGDDSISDVSMAVEKGRVVSVEGYEKHRFNVHGVADAGDHSYNQDGLVVHYNDLTDRFNIVMTHGPQFNPIAANLTNAAAIRAALELTRNPNISQSSLMDLINNNTDLVAEELGESGSKVQTSLMQLKQTGHKNTFTLDLLNPGTNHCIVVDTNNGDVRIIEKSDQQQRIPVKTGDIVIAVTDELVKAIKTSRKESQDLYLGNRFFIESKTGTPLKEICDGIIRESREEGLDSGVSLAALKVPEGTDIRHEPL